MNKYPKAKTVQSPPWMLIVVCKHDKMVLLFILPL